MPAKARTPRAPRTAAVPPPEEIDTVLDALDTPATDVVPPVTDEDGVTIPDAFQFTTEGEEPAEPTKDDEKTFTIDGVELKAYRPSPGSWTVLMAGLSSSADPAQRANAILGFVDHSFAPEAQWYVKERLLSRKDKFDINVLQRVVMQLIEHWAPASPNRAARRAAARR